MGHIAFDSRVDVSPKKFKVRLSAATWRRGGEENRDIEVKFEVIGKK